LVPLASLLLSSKGEFWDICTLRVLAPTKDLSSSEVGNEVFGLFADSFVTIGVETRFELGSSRNPWLSLQRSSEVGSAFFGRVASAESFVTIGVEARFELGSARKLWLSLQRSSEVGSAFVGRVASVTIGVDVTV